MENIYKIKISREQLSIIELFMDYSKGYLSENITWNEMKPVVDRLLTFAPLHKEIDSLFKINIDVNINLLVEKIIGGIAFIVTNANRGAFFGKCNRYACDSKHKANWFNHSTLMFYCPTCAHLLNYENKKDALALYGHDLCTFGLYHNK